MAQRLFSWQHLAGELRAQRGCVRYANAGKSSPIRTARCSEKIKTTKKLRDEHHDSFFFYCNFLWTGDASAHIFFSCSFYHFRRQFTRCAKTFRKSSVLRSRLLCANCFKENAREGAGRPRGFFGHDEDTLVAFRNNP